MSHTDYFSKNIENFERYGTYVYKFDAVGNLTFDSSSTDFSRVYLALPLNNPVYNNSKIQAFYDPIFTEFIPPPVETTEDSAEEVQQQVNVLEEENASLKSLLETLTVQSESDDSEANQLATKQVILELRKALGEGRVDSDFSEDFPYAPVRKTSNITSDSAASS
jgi:hypothetical protein